MTAAFVHWPASIGVVLAIALVVVVVAGHAQAQDESQVKVPKERKFVRVSLGKRTTKAVGDLGQAVTSYHVNMDIGRPAKQFRMLVDVNARENFVPHYSKLGFIYKRLNYRDGYSRKDSSTCSKEENEILTIAYGGCTFSGKAYTDTFELKNVLESYKEVSFRQKFLAMSHASNDRFAKYAVDGVMALNPWPISATGSELVSVGLARAELMGELKFALYLAKDQNDGEDPDVSGGNQLSAQGGELTLGGFNPTKFLGALRFHQVVTQHSWELSLASVMLGGHSIKCDNNSTTALLSTSSNGITGPANAINEILNLLGVQNTDSSGAQGKLYLIDCDKRNDGPELSFYVEDARYSIPPSDYIKERPDGYIFKKSGCYLELYSNYAESNRWELGTYFLSNYYTVFDINNRKVALGSLARA